MQGVKYFCFPSFEGLAVITETDVSGIPVITTDHCWSRFSEDGVDGWIVPHQVLSEAS
jgi:hypothetical protein